MLALSRRTIPTAVLTLALGFATAGCSSDSTGPEINPAVVGTWNATSIVVGGGGELIDQGMSLTFVFASNGTYTFNVTNDQGGLCDGAANCSDSGDYTASDTQIVLDPDDDPVTLGYSISGSTVTVNADLEGTPLTIVMDEA
jgi:hypothetical protein